MTAIFQRLIGLETEYAVRYRPQAGGRRPSDHELYTQLAGMLAGKLPTASAVISAGG